MKNSVMQNNGRVDKWLLIVALSLAVMIRVGVADGATLIHNNSTVQIDPSSQAGVNQWVVDGASFLNQRWFWYRVGSAPEQSINSIGAPVVTPLSPYSVQLLYTLPGSFDIQVTYTLTGGLLGSGRSDLSEQVLINNYSGGVLDFHFFQYSDFNLGASDSLVLGQNLLGKFNRATQSSPAGSLEEIVSPGANRGEAAVAGFTLGRLNDGVATTLNNSLNAIGDVTWAFQWDFQIAAGLSAQIGTDTIVPEPATGALVGIGIALLLGAARRRLG